MAESWLPLTSRTTSMGCQTVIQGHAVPRPRTDARRHQLGCNSRIDKDNVEVLKAEDPGSPLVTVENTEQAYLSPRSSTLAGDGRHVDALTTPRDLP